MTTGISAAQLPGITGWHAAPGAQAPIVTPPAGRPAPPPPALPFAPAMPQMPGGATPISGVSAQIQDVLKGIQQLLQARGAAPQVAPTAPGAAPAAPASAAAAPGSVDAIATESLNLQNAKFDTAANTTETVGRLLTLQGERAGRLRTALDAHATQTGTPHAKGEAFLKAEQTAMGQVQKMAQLLDKHAAVAGPDDFARLRDIALQAASTHTVPPSRTADFVMELRSKAGEVSREGQEAFMAVRPMLRNLEQQATDTWRSLRAAEAGGQDTQALRAQFQQQRDLVNQMSVRLSDVTIGQSKAQLTAEDAAAITQAANGSPQDLLDALTKAAAA
jgi:hypothetical protein